MKFCAFVVLLVVGVLSQEPNGLPEYSQANGHVRFDIPHNVLKQFAVRNRRRYSTPHESPSLVDLVKENQAFHIFDMILQVMLQSNNHWIEEEWGSYFSHWQFVDKEENQLFASAVSDSILDAIFRKYESYVTKDGGMDYAMMRERVTSKLEAMRTTRTSDDSKLMFLRTVRAAIQNVQNMQSLTHNVITKITFGVQACDSFCFSFGLGVTYDQSTDDMYIHAIDGIGSSAAAIGFEDGPFVSVHKYTADTDTPFDEVNVVGHMSPRGRFTDIIFNDAWQVRGEASTVKVSSSDVTPVSFQYCHWSTYPVAVADARNKPGKRRRLKKGGSSSSTSDGSGGDKDKQSKDSKDSKDSKESKEEEKKSKGGVKHRHRITDSDDDTTKGTKSIQWFTFVCSLVAMLVLGCIFGVLLKRFFFNKNEQYTHEQEPLVASARSVEMICKA